MPPGPPPSRSTNASSKRGAVGSTTPPCAARSHRVGHRSAVLQHDAHRVTLDHTIAHAVECKRCGQHVAAFVAHPAQPEAPSRHALRQFGRRAVELDAPVVQQQHRVATLGFVEIRRRPDHGHAVARQRIHHRQQLARDSPDRRRRSARRAAVRRASPSTRTQARAFASCRRTVCRRDDRRMRSRPVKCSSCANVSSSAALLRAAQLRVKPQVLDHREVFVQAKALRHVAVFRWIVSANATTSRPADADVPFGRRHQRGDHADQRRLAGTVRPNESGEAPGANVGRHAPQRLEIIETLDDVADLDRGVQLNPRPIEPEPRPSPAFPVATRRRRRRRQCAGDKRGLFAGPLFRPTSA